MVVVSTFEDRPPHDNGYLELTPLYFSTRTQLTCATIYIGLQTKREIQPFFFNIRRTSVLIKAGPEMRDSDAVVPSLRIPSSIYVPPACPACLTKLDDGG